MRSVPPRGSGWVAGFLISDFRLLIVQFRKSPIQEPARYRAVVLTSCHGNKRKEPTRYRVVVLTSCHCNERWTSLDNVWVDKLQYLAGQTASVPEISPESPAKPALTSPLEPRVKS